ncbi:hypothetical protein J5TS1_16650 [Bacillus licheniformis]|jgi:hypothetical protein|uniref:Uncharacterized protein n=2 Tax=Bacillus licheniformis TaxID=1402 RepID=A4VFC1_BACLD|nr:hypothetical protein BL07044 [Bacillus licheniformis DSM 13 = ATCC 14580]AKQ73836.1 hypothetical protein MUY_002704 [Bacillus licheniformis WX-02]EQM27585.1 hypothetical protein N399_14600 [Bacillus licheniformis CG-B52]KJH56336.1 hypothetical protein UF14_13720 [Bacillus licheniformis]KUL10891.1 hypothetical protein LI17339_11455 [Bacillus licheniformis LMG 17339]
MSMKRNEYERMTARGETGRGKPKSGAEGASWGNSESLRQKNSCLTQLWREFVSYYVLQTTKGDIFAFDAK